MSIHRDELVIIRTTNLSGWCYAEKLNGDRGYIPFAYSSAFLPTTDFVPEWQEVLTVRTSNEPVSRMHHSIRKDLVLAQRRSRLYAQNSKSYIQNSSKSVRLSESMYNRDKDITQKEKIKMMKKFFTYYSEYIASKLISLRPCEALSFEGLYYALYESSRFNRLSQSQSFNDEFKRLMEKMHISVKTMSSFIPLYFMGSPIQYSTEIDVDSRIDLEGSNRPTFVFIENDAELKEINPTYSAHESLRTASSHSERMESLKRDIDKLRSTVFSINHYTKSQKEKDPPVKQPDVEKEIHCIPDIYDYSFYDFVSIYFHREKARFFHNPTIEEMASFSAKIPIRSLIHVEHSQLQDLLEMERWIMSILGLLPDSTTGQGTIQWGHMESTDFDRLLNLLYQLASRKDLVDEIFCFLVKESIDSPDSVIEIKVYEVLFVILQCFRPSYHFLNYLASYLLKKVHNHDEVAALALASLFALLDETFVSADVLELKERLSDALSKLETVELVHLPTSLIGCSIKELLLLEKTARQLTRHGIPLKTEGLFEQSPPSTVMEHIIDEKNMTQHFLNGVTMNIRLPEQRITKERVFWISPACDKICWQTRNHNKTYFIPVDSIQEIKTDVIDNVQAIVIVTSYNFYKSNTSSRSLNKDMYSINLFIPSRPEIRRIKIFLSSLCKWANEKKEELATDSAGLDGKEKEVFDALTSQHQIQSSFIAITTKRQNSFITFFRKEIGEHIGEYLIEEEGDMNGLMKEYSATVPRLFIRILSRMKELKACEVHNIFRENGDIQLRDQYLKQLAEGSYEKIDEIDNAHLLSSIFKRLFFLMEEPLIPHEIYKEVMKCDTSDFEGCLRICSMLPKEVYDVFFFCLHMFCCYLDHPSNSLTARGFSICFVQNILRGDETSDLEQFQFETDKALNFVTTLLSGLSSTKQYPQGMFDWCVCTNK